MVGAAEKKFFLLWHGSYRRYILAHFMPADEYRAYVSLRTYADPIHAAPCSEQMAKAVYTAGYGIRHSGFRCLRDCFRGEVENFFVRFPYWDTIMHTLNGIV